jgi:hypothetical protein
MEPATPLVLTKDDHAFIGEIVEIMGQVDHTMVRTVGRLLSVDAAAAAKIMGSTRVADNSAIWAQVIRNRVTNQPEIAQLIAIAQGAISDMAELRNGFIHAIYSGDYVEAGYVKPGYQTTSAKRIKSGKRRSTSELRGARDKAATLSCLVAHVDHLTKADGDRAPSPWHERLAPLLQTHQQSQKPRHQGKGRGRPPEPSQG